LTVFSLPAGREIASFKRLIPEAKVDGSTIAAAPPLSERTDEEVKTEVDVPEQVPAPD
jgi:hypothetical protein